MTTLQSLMKRMMIFVTVLGATLTSAFATVGGAETIEILGYEPKDKKIYVLRHFEDERGRLPQLYYYNLDSVNPYKLVESRSIYVNPKTNNYDEFDYHNAFFNTRLEKIKQRLQKLDTDFQPSSVEVVNIKQKRVPAWLGGHTYEYNIRFRLLSHDDNSKSKEQSVTAYDVALFTSPNVYKVPNQPYTITKVTYTGTDMELRYQYEDVVLLKKSN